jgi:hypothetical protein
MTYDGHVLNIYPSLGPETFTSGSKTLFGIDECPAYIELF